MTNDAEGGRLGGGPSHPMTRLQLHLPPPAASSSSFPSFSFTPYFSFISCSSSFSSPFFSPFCQELVTL